MIVGVGVDIIEIERIKEAIESFKNRFLTRIFNDEEIAYAESRVIPFQHYAGRFAAKEAVYKALGEKTLTWKDMTILNDAQGKPQVFLKHSILNKKIHLSISHSKYYAIAQAIVEQIG